MLLNNNIQINKIDKSLSDNQNISINEKKNNNTQLNKIKDKFQENKENNNINNNKKENSLDFYALGKVANQHKYISNIKPNKAFRSTSNDLLNRNIFSINSPKYDDLKKNKNNSILSEQNIKENNYLNPLEVFNTYKKYSIPSNVSNIETYNISKKKIFNKSNIPLIKKGLQITYTNFIDCKKKILTEKYSRNNKIEPINEKNLTRIKTESNYKLNKKNNEIKAKYGFDNKKNINYNNINKPIIQYIDPIDHTKKELKGNSFYFDKNNKQFLRHKNWWIPEK